MAWAGLLPLLGSLTAGPRSLWRHWFIAAAIGAILSFIVAVVFPYFGLLYGYSGVKRLLYEDLSLSDAWSSFFAIIGSFIYAILWLPMLQLTLRVVVWKFDPRKTAGAFAAWMVIYGHAPLLHALFGSEVCFNQRTGEPIKWFVVQPGGQIVLYDSSGYDAAGAQKNPATAQICRVLRLQKKGLRPHEISDDPRNVKFFDVVTGQPRVWYSKGEDGKISLFDGEGTNPATGELLKPITKNEAQAAKAQAAAKQAEAERVAQLKVEQEGQKATEAERKARLEVARKEAEAKENAQRRLVDIFDVASYSAGVVIVGAVPQQNSDTSALAARDLVAGILVTLKRKSVPADEFRPQVYADGYFKTIFSGNAAVLTEVGLKEKMRAALLASVNSSCRLATSDLRSCIVTVEIRILNASGAASLMSISETGAGGTAEQAVSRAVELIAERHPDIFEGI